MDETARAATPLHLWIVGGLGALWNAFGCYDYLMTRMRNTDYLASMMPGTDPQAILSYIDSFPVWAQAGWGLGVWGGLIGSILLLVRNRWAVLVLGLSLLGAIVGLGYQLLNPPTDIPAASEGFNAMVPYVIIAIALALFLYARAQRAKGVLR